MERRSKRPRRRGRGLLFLLALGVLAGLYVRWGNTALQASSFSPVLRDLPQGFDGCRLVVLGDLHSTFFGEKNQRLLEAVEAQEPEYIFLVGDLLDAFRDIPPGYAEETAAGLAGLFFTGVTAGRALSGFLTLGLNDRQMVRLGHGVTGLGVAALLLPAQDPRVALAGLVLIGLGCAPVYPCLIHSTPEHFGAENSQAVIGVQMASAYVGTCLMPPLFGLVASRITPALFPVYLLALLAGLVAAHEWLQRRTALQGDSLDG